MKTLKNHFKLAKNFKSFTKSYINYLNDSLKHLDIDSLDQIRKELEIAKKKKIKVDPLGFVKYVIQRYIM